MLHIWSYKPTSFEEEAATFRMVSVSVTQQF